MEKVIIIRYGELYLKGKNRGFFERALETNVRRVLDGVDCTFIKQSGRYFVRDFDEYQTDEIIEKLSKVFGIHSLSIALETSADLESIFEGVKQLARVSGTFKVETHRGDKRYPLTSVEISKKIGGMLLNYAKGSLSVDVHSPEFVVRIDVRERNVALVFCDFIEGANGMPVGTAGKGLL